MTVCPVLLTVVIGVAAIIVLLVAAMYPQEQVAARTGLGAGGHHDVLRGELRDHHTSGTKYSTSPCVSKATRSRAPTSIAGRRELSEFIYYYMYYQRITLRLLLFLASTGETTTTD
jgi:hypothetical protein